MKKIFTILLSLFISVSVFAQLNITSESDTIPCTLDAAAYYSFVQVENTGNEAIDLKWGTKVLNLPDGWIFYLCTSLTCYEASVTSSPISENISVGAGETYEFKFYYEADANSGAAMGDSARVKFNVKVDGAAVSDDEVLMVGTTTSPSSINLIQDGSLTVTPSIVENQLIVTNTNNERVLGNLTLTSIAGQVVLQEALNGDKSFVELAQLQSGIYIANITNSDGQIIYATKLLKK